MAIPAKFLNGGNAWVQKADAGSAMGHPDTILAYTLGSDAGQNEIRFFEYAVAGPRIGKWSTSIAADAVAGNDDVTFVNPKDKGSTQTISLVSAGVTEWSALTGGAKTYFYATSAPFNPSTTKPYAGGTYDPAKGGGTAPGTGTSQSTMYMLGGGALIGLLFLFAQK
jgi:LPXTG-motif cell wall-anchored protein